MAAKDQQILNNLKIFGLALTIPTVMVCGPLLGYGIAKVLIQKGVSPSLALPLFVGAGAILALVQTFRTVKLISQNEAENSKGTEAKNNHGREHT